jgi:hypothetical protein
MIVAIATKAAIVFFILGALLAARLGMKIRSPDERSDIRGDISTGPDFASLIRATNFCATP